MTCYQVRSRRKERYDCKNSFIFHIFICVICVICGSILSDLPDLFLYYPPQKNRQGINKDTIGHPFLNFFVSFEFFMVYIFLFPESEILPACQPLQNQRPRIRPQIIHHPPANILINVPKSNVSTDYTDLLV